MRSSIDLRSPTLRAVAIGLLILLLQIPMLLVSELASERRIRRDDVTAEISEKWGARQTVIGPWIEVPYEVAYEEGPVESRVHRFLPTTLSASAGLQTELRARSIFAVPVYTAMVSMNGSFTVPEIDGATTVHWDDARLVVSIDDPSAIQSASAVSWDEAPRPFRPATQAVEAPVVLSGAGAEHAFAFDLELAGTEGLFLVPVGEDSTIDVHSAWPHPSFQGSWLPAEHDVSEGGFSAKWRVTDLARGFPTQWGGDDQDMRARLRSAAVGVELGTSVDPYVMSARSTRYAILFFAAVFGVLWVLELRGSFRLHPLHYLLTGAALCSFHLLILALSEHLGFSGAYGLAAGMVTLLLVYYAHRPLGGPAGASVVGATCMGIYGYLYVCLANEDHALLFGALGVFVGVAALMVLTRRVAYVAPAPSEPEPQAEPDRLSGEPPAG